MEKRRFSVLVLVLLGVSGVLALLALRCSDPERVAVCGGREMVLRVALGGIDGRLESMALDALGDGRPACLTLNRIQDVPEPKAAFFYDKDRDCPEGDDLNSLNGIDVAPLFFFAGHGDPTGWLTDGGKIVPGCMKIGNAAGGGVLRYYFQCSCEVFAHGPAVSKDSYLDFPEPWEFKGGAETDNMKNVFRRWGPVLGDSLRLACGSSTALTCQRGQLDRVWKNKLAFFDVSDSWIEGLYSGSGSIPICVTRARGENGKPFPDKSGLFDPVFFAEARGEQGQDDFLFVEYPRPFAPQGTVGGSSPSHFPVYALPTVDIGTSYFIEGQPWYLRWRGFWPKRKTDLLVYNKKGGRLTSLRANCPEDPACKGNEWFLKNAIDFIKTANWGEPDLGPPEGFRLLIDSIPVYGDELVRFQKGVIVRFSRVVRAAGRRLREEDLDGTIVVLMNNQGSVLRAWKLWLPLEEVEKQAGLSSRDMELLQEAAVLELGNESRGYNVGGIEVVYKREGRRLIPFARFRAEPREVGTLIAFPPRIIDISIESVRR